MKWSRAYRPNSRETNSVHVGYTLDSQHDGEVVVGHFAVRLPGVMLGMLSWWYRARCMAYGYGAHMGHTRGNLDVHGCVVVGGERVPGMLVGILL